MSIAHVDAEAGFSGGELQVFLLMEGLRRRGHRNRLVCPPGSRAAEEGRARGFETRLVPMRSDLDLPAVGRLARALAGVDLAHLHTGRATWLGGLGARLAGVPAITTRRMDRPVARGWRTRWIYTALARRAVAISPAVARCLAEGGVESARVRTIPSAVDPAALAVARSRAELRAELGAEPGDVVFLSLAALVPRKGLDVLVDALAELAPAQPFKAWIAGEGPERAALEQRVASRGLAGRVRLLGQRSDKADLLNACDVVAMPSRREGLGVTALEALALGRPVVASQVGGLADLAIDGVAGLGVPPGDAAALAAALARLAGDPELRAALGRAGPARVAAGHTAEQMVAAYEALYREVLAEDAAARATSGIAPRR